MPWEEWRDVGPETVGLASDISRGAHLSSRRPRIESHSEPETTVKEGSTLQSPSSSSSFLLSLSFLLFSHLHRDLSLLLSPGSRPFFSIFPFFSLFFSFFPLSPLTAFDRLTARFPVNESEFSRLYNHGLPITANA